MLQALRTVQSRTQRASAEHCNQEHAPWPDWDSWFAFETFGRDLENHLMSKAYTENARASLCDARANKVLDITSRTENEGE